MKHFTGFFCIALLLYTGVGKGYDFGGISTATRDLRSDSYLVSSLNHNKGLLESTKITLGTIYKSHHFNNADRNETHNGIYVSVAGWSLGTYRNSGNVQSNFITYNPNLYRSKHLEVNAVAGMADGYEGWNYAQDGFLPIVGVSAQWMYLKTMVTPDVLAFGIELPLN